MLVGLILGCNDGQSGGGSKRGGSSGREGVGVVGGKGSDWGAGEDIREMRLKNVKTNKSILFTLDQ